ncbi:AAA-16 domain-containing protein [Phanerochaete sordida]|uniref:AAA-16 domain-containing protein n=1 Tax=Phanerochaete sordida TaxID=48140 RepID=A0A9P3GNU5_9APHY|nr:AAA-16 domain-containing protein [Phanerochaete sordida]
MSSTRERPSPIDTALAVAGPMLDILKDGLALVNHPGVGLVPQGLSAVLDGIKLVRTNSKSRQDFEREARVLSALLSGAQKAVDSSFVEHEGEHDTSESQAISTVVHSPELQRGMRNLLQAIEDLSKRTSELRGGDRAMVSFIFALHNKDILEGMTTDLTRAVQHFQTLALAAVDKAVEYIKRHLILAKLKCADAGYRSVHIEKSLLMEGTRDALLSEFLSRFQGSDPTAKRLNVVTGGAGMGKSAIAYRLCALLDTKSNDDISTPPPSGTPALGASFFFDLRDPDLSSDRMLIPTIARQLAERVPSLLPHMIEAIRDFLPHGESQLSSFAVTALLLKPLERVKDLPLHPIVIVIDGLDECTDQESLCDILKSLVSLVRTVRWLHLFVASRPESLIREALLSSSAADVVHRRDLGESSVIEDTEGDIKKYLMEKIESLPEYAAYTATPHGSEDLNHLVHRAGNLFIYARTVFLVLSRPPYRTRPVEGFQFVLSPTAHLSNIDALYLQILTVAYPPSLLTASPGVHTHLLCFLTFIACGKYGWPPATFAIIGNYLAATDYIHSRTAAAPASQPMTEASISQMTAELSSVMRIGECGSILPIHVSFMEFLVDSNRCPNKHYHISENAARAGLVSASFAVFQLETALDILAAWRTRDNTPVGQFGTYIALALPMHIKTCVFSDGIAKEIMAFIQSAGLLNYCRLLSATRPKIMRKCLSDLQTSFVQLLSNNASPPVREVEVRCRIEFCRKYVEQMLHNPNKHAQEITQEIYTQTYISSSPVLTPEEAQRFEELKCSCERLHHEIIRDARAQEMWYDTTIEHRGQNSERRPM